jgi:hypothetical protein
MANSTKCLTKKCPDCKRDWDPYGSPKFNVMCNLCGNETSPSWFTEMNDLGWPQKPVKMTELPKPECAERHVQDIRVLSVLLGMTPDKGFQEVAQKVRKLIDEKAELLNINKELVKGALPGNLCLAMKGWAMKEDFYIGEVRSRAELEDEVEKLEEELRDFKGRGRY